MFESLSNQFTIIDSDTGDSDRLKRMLRSGPLSSLASVLADARLTVGTEPIVFKPLNESYYRLMLPVTGGPIELGCVVSVVCLYDCQSEQTVYAHAMHAGPAVNPLLEHLDGPMASPKAQEGVDGDRATRRIVEHKRALWDRFLLEKEALGEVEAGHRWRASYYWALKRLYYCTRCTPCRWGSPFFEGPMPGTDAYPSATREGPAPAPLPGWQTEMVRSVRSSDAWRVEVGYASRGDFAVSEHPRLIKRLDGDFVQLLFETDASAIQAGTLVALSVTYNTHRKHVRLAHTISAGPDADVQFLRGDVSLGLPQPQQGFAAAQAKTTYVSWRRNAWSRFWINELERGVAQASQSWIQEFWTAITELFGGNDMPRLSTPLESRNQVSTSPSNDSRTASLSIPIASVEAIGDRCFAGHAASPAGDEFRSLTLSTLMVNLGRRCNQACRHCHVDAGPNRTEEMSRETMDMVLEILRNHPIQTLDITGGAPEMNPHFRYFVHEASPHVSRIVDRCNLTILSEPGYEDLAAFLAVHKVEITASLPCYEADNVDLQRGRGTFEKSIAALKTLNKLGYGVPGRGPELNLVYNPLGADLAPPEAELERSYKRELSERFGVTFNRLFAMNNVPVNRFRDDLNRKRQLTAYMSKLVEAFNPKALANVMCRHMISVGWDGRLYDCDFNQAAGIPLAEALPQHIRDFDFQKMAKRLVNVASHCFACPAGAGSSCNGSLVAASGEQGTHFEQHGGEHP